MALQESKVSLDTQAFTQILANTEDLKLYHLAMSLGISTKTLKRWRTGATKQVERSKVEKMAEYLGVSVQSILLDNEEATGTVVEIEREEERFVDALVKENWSGYTSFFSMRIINTLPTSLRSKCLLYSAFMYWMIGNINKSYESANELLKLGLKEQNEEIICAAKSILPSSLLFMNQIDKAIDHASYAAKMSTEAKMIALSHLQLVNCYFLSLQFDQLTELRSKAQQASYDVGSRAIVSRINGHIYSVLACSKLLCGDKTGALYAFGESTAIDQFSYVGKRSQVFLDILKAKQDIQAEQVIGQLKKCRNDPYQPIYCFALASFYLQSGTDIATDQILDYGLSITNKDNLIALDWLSKSSHLKDRIGEKKLASAFI